MRRLIGSIAVLCTCSLLLGQEMPDATTFTNSCGMTMHRISAGHFMMGSEDGEWDERPVREVTISKPYYLGITEVTNVQYEQFDPQHKKLRGKLGYSQADDEAVVFVSWEDAVAFCKWLSQKEGRPYRLPAEAEWEYACRAGTTTRSSTGDELPPAFQKNVRNSWFPSRQEGGEVVPLHVGKTPPNPWGLLDMHGNVEEWCLDWYGPYEASDRVDPVGRADGDFRVTRGGSHSTTLEYLRSANRMGTLPQDKHWLIGFRVALGEMPQTETLGVEPARRWARDVRQDKADWSKGPDPEKPFFKGPIQYVKIPPGSEGPLYSRHNHCPALVACPNGDLLAIWYSCRTEPGRELGIAASRLRRGSDEWEQAEPFWDAPDRNDHASALYLHDDGTIFHFNGLGAGGTWGALAAVMRTSTDNGATWSKASLIMPEHGPRHMPIESVFQTKEGYLIVPCDAVTGGGGGSAVLISRDGDKTWTDPGEGRDQPDFSEGGQGAWIAGIHAGVVQLKDGRLMAFGRGNTINGRMPMSISADMGRTWTYRASPFPPIGGGQRLVLTRLNEGPIFFASFASSMEFEDRKGKMFTGAGLFAALSYDEGRTWDIRRLITPGGPARTVDGGGNTGMFVMSDTSAEPKGYMSVHQTPDNTIHLISSKQYYAFNLTWLKQDPPAPAEPPSPVELEPKARLDKVFEANRLPTEAGWRFNGTNVREEQVVELVDGALKILTGKSQRVRWVGDSTETFGAARGAHTAQITMRVTRSTADSRGIDFETYVPGLGRAFITVTTSAVHWFAGSFEPLAQNLDNASAMHTYRLAVDAAGHVSIFRDRKLLGVRKAHPSHDNIRGRMGAYLQWGEGAGASEADAIVDTVASDLGGPYRPDGAGVQSITEGKTLPASSQRPKPNAGGELPMSPVNNRNYDKTRAQRLVSERVWLYRPEKEWTYSHHPHLGLFKGRLYAMWSNGKEHEDRSGQRVLLCSSDDFGQWTEPEVLAVPEPASRVLTVAGFYCHEGVLAAYFGDYGPNKETTRLKVRTTTDGKIWSEVKDVGIPVCPNYGLQKTVSGRLIICGNMSYPYTDNPSGLAGWTMTGICQRKHAGEHKGGQYGYPHTLIYGGRLYVIVSRMKEAAEVLRIDLKQI